MTFYCIAVGGTKIGSNLHAAFSETLRGSIVVVQSWEGSRWEIHAVFPIVNHVVVRYVIEWYCSKVLVPGDDLDLFESLEYSCKAYGGNGHL